MWIRTALIRADIHREQTAHRDISRSLFPTTTLRTGELEYEFTCMASEAGHRNSGGDLPRPGLALNLQFTVLF